MRVTVTPARLFAFLTTLTLEALRKNHMVSTAFEAIARTETNRLVVPRAISNLSWIVKNTTEVGRELRQCWRRCVGCCGMTKKKVLRL